MMFSTKSTQTVVAALLLIGTVASIALIGPAAAQLDGTETEFYNNTTNITEDTTEIRTTINGTNGSNVYVNYYRIANDTNNTETLEREGVILSSNGGETSHEYAVSTTGTAAYRVVVHDNGNGLSASDVGPITVSALGSGSGGGGFFTNPDGSYNIPIIGGLALIGLFLIKRGD